MLIMLNLIEELLVCCITRVLEMMGGLVDKIHISCCAAGTRRFVVICRLGGLETSSESCS